MGRRGGQVSYLELVLKEVLLVGHLAIETQQTLLLRSQRLASPGCQLGSFCSVRSGWPTAKTYTDINLVLLVGVHDGDKRMRSASLETDSMQQRIETKADPCVCGCGCVVLQGRVTIGNP